MCLRRDKPHPPSQNTDPEPVVTPGDETDPEPGSQIDSTQILFSGKTKAPKLIFEQKGGVQSVSFTAPEKWTAYYTMGISWFKVNTTRGKKGESSISIAVMENFDYQERTDSVTITSGSDSEVIVFTQRNMLGFTVYGPNPVQMPTEGGEFNVQIEYNIEFDVTPEVDWILPATRASDVQREALSFIVSPNNSGAPRTGNIVFSSKDGSISQTLTVEQEYKETIIELAGPANCFIVPGPGKYRFKATKGNSDTVVENPYSVKVLWESIGTVAWPEVGVLVSDVKYEDGYIYFTATQSKGNAVVAAMLNGSDALWSWHLWFTDQPADQTYTLLRSNGAYLLENEFEEATLMDRNLGATSATPGWASSYGLFYQWGRKDPFLGLANIDDQSRAQSTNQGKWNSVNATSEKYGSIEYSIKNPMVFLQRYAGNKDWVFVQSDELTENTRWGTVKTIYDPCPLGYRVPDGGELGLWASSIS